MSDGVIAYQTMFTKFLFKTEQVNVSWEENKSDLIDVRLYEVTDAPHEYKLHHTAGGGGQIYKKLSGLQYKEYN